MVDLMRLKQEVLVQEPQQTSAAISATYEISEDDDGDEGETEGPPTLVCVLCSRTETAPDQLAVHICADHLRWMPFKCAICTDDVQFASQQAVRAHFKDTHTDLQPQALMVLHTMDDGKQEALTSLVDISVRHSAGDVAAGAAFTGVREGGAAVVGGADQSTALTSSLLLLHRTMTGDILTGVGGMLTGYFGPLTTHTTAATSGLLQPQQQQQWRQEGMKVATFAASPASAFRPPPAHRATPPTVAEARLSLSRAVALSTSRQQSHNTRLIGQRSIQTPITALTNVDSNLPLLSNSRQSQEVALNRGRSSLSTVQQSRSSSVQRSIGADETSVKTCRVCGMSVDESRTKWHLLKEHLQRWNYSCSKCDYGTHTDAIAVRQHIAQKHSGSAQLVQASEFYKAELEELHRQCFAPVLTSKRTRAGSAYPTVSVLERGSKQIDAREIEAKRTRQSNSSELESQDVRQTVSAQYNRTPAVTTVVDGSQRARSSLNQSEVTPVRQGSQSTPSDTAPERALRSSTVQRASDNSAVTTSGGQPAQQRSTSKILPPPLHSINRQFVSCLVCDIKVNKKNMREHVYRIHMKTHSVGCSECDFGTYRCRRTVFNHILNTHGGRGNVKSRIEELTEEIENWYKRCYPSIKMGPVNAVRHLSTSATDADTSTQQVTGSPNATMDISQGNWENGLGELVNGGGGLESGYQTKQELMDTANRRPVTKL